MFPVESLAILVPLKGFATAKSRLRLAGVDDVEALARSLATNVVRSCRPRPTYVASESRDVTEFAVALGVRVIESSSKDLNEAVANSYRFLSQRFERIVVAHGDLRNPTGLGDFNPSLGITIVTDARGVGTNVLALPGDTEFTFHFGANSALAHEREARRLGFEVQVDRASPWRFDVDEPDDICE